MLYYRLLFCEVLHTNQVYMKELTVVNPSWLEELAPHFYEKIIDRDYSLWCRKFCSGNCEPCSWVSTVLNFWLFVVFIVIIIQRMICELEKNWCNLFIPFISCNFIFLIIFQMLNRAPQRHRDLRSTPNCFCVLVKRHVVFELLRTKEGKWDLEINEVILNSWNIFWCLFEKMQASTHTDQRLKPRDQTLIQC